jgi:hypothetical protein
MELKKTLIPKNWKPQNRDVTLVKLRGEHSNLEP